MAGFTPFIAENIDHPSIYNLVKASFTEFLIRNISQFPESDRLPVNLPGALAGISGIFSEAAREAGFQTGIITESPMEWVC
jgi:glucosamine kinase